ncbi:MAG: type II toxin-antitoxin system RelE/ParE family toxin [bacterium]|nr:type II toxin-antitoxin system RelE/ParE family toxin [bacterium]
MQVKFHKIFKKKFKKLPPWAQKKFYERLEVFLRNDHDAVLRNHSVDKAYPNCRSINISGDYRAIYYHNGDEVIFIIIGTHAELYK